jgi:signal transduction histidine kinase
MKTKTFFCSVCAPSVGHWFCLVLPGARRTFFDAFASHMAAALASSTAREEERQRAEVHIPCVFYTRSAPTSLVCQRGELAHPTTDSLLCNKQALEELDKAKTVFFSNISHEFRTPLTLMLGPIEVRSYSPGVREPLVQLPPRQTLQDLLSQAELQIEREPLTLIHRNALRLYKLVNSLLDFSRIEAGRARAQFEAVDLAALTQDLASIFRSAIER